MLTQADPVSGKGNPQLAPRSPAPQKRVTRIMIDFHEPVTGAAPDQRRQMIAIILDAVENLAAEAEGGLINAGIAAPDNHFEEWAFVTFVTAAVAA